MSHSSSGSDSGRKDDKKPSMSVQRRDGARTVINTRGLTTKQGGMDFKILAKRIQELKKRQQEQGQNKMVMQTSRVNVDSNIIPPRNHVTPNEPVIAKSPDDNIVPKTPTLPPDRTARKQVDSKQLKKETSSDQDSILVDEGCLVDAIDSAAGESKSDIGKGFISPSAVIDNIAKDCKDILISPAPLPLLVTPPEVVPSESSEASSANEQKKVIPDVEVVPSSKTGSTQKFRPTFIMTRPTGQKPAFRLPIFQPRLQPIIPEIPRDNTFDVESALLFKDRIVTDEPAKGCLKKGPSTSSSSSSITIDDRYVEQVHMSPPAKPRQFKKPKGETRTRLYRLADKARLYEDKYNCALPEQYYDYTPPELEEELEALEERRRQEKKEMRRARGNYPPPP